MKEIYFDMDGTIADFYGVENWLNYLQHFQTKPYREAKPLVNMRKLSKEINRLQSIGYKVGVISWLSKASTEEYDERVIKAKKAWLRVHLGSVQFDKIVIIKHGTPKENYGKGILFDDEKQNRVNWNKASAENTAFDVENILEVLKAIL